MPIRRRIPPWIPFAVLLSILAPPPPHADDGPLLTRAELRARALDAHPSLDAARAAAEAAEAEALRARAYPDPALALSFGRGRPRDGGGDGRSERAIELSQTVERPALRRARAQAARLDGRAAALERARAELTVDTTLARLIATAAFADRRIGVAREAADVAGRLRDLVARRVELGEASPLEEARARGEWFARRRDTIEAEGARVAARAALDRFCGGLPEGFRIAVPAATGPGALPADLERRLLDGNPALARAAATVELSAARADVERAAVLPGIELSAGRETELDKTAWGVGVALTLPLWNRSRGEIAAAEARSAEASAELRALRRELATALDRAVADWRAARDALALHAEGWTASARRALEIATFSFENGEASLLDVLDAQRADLAVRLAEAESRFALADAAARIEALVGAPLDGSAADRIEGTDEEVADVPQS